MPKTRMQKRKGLTAQVDRRRRTATGSGSSTAAASAPLRDQATPTAQPTDHPASQIEVVQLSSDAGTSQGQSGNGHSFNVWGTSPPTNIGPNVLPAQNVFSMSQGSFGHDQINKLTSSTTDPVSSHVPKQLCEKIWRNEYINIALLVKSGRDLQDLFAGGSLFLNEKGMLEARPKSSKEKISCIEKWTDAFIIFIHVYLKQHPDQALELVQYMSLIREAAVRNNSMAWRTYDEQFRLRQAECFQPWGTINADMWLRAMTPGVSSTQLPTGTNTQSGQRRRESCFDFNSGNCSRPYCKYQHNCISCGGRHPESMCRPGDTGQMPKPGSQRGSFRPYRGRGNHSGSTIRFNRGQFRQ